MTQLQEVDPGRDLQFIENIFDYHLRRDEAIGGGFASLILQTLRSYLITATSMELVTELTHLEQVNNLHEIIVDNKATVANLLAKAERSKSEKNIQNYYTEAVRLYEEAADALTKLELM